MIKPRLPLALAVLIVVFVASASPGYPAISVSHITESQFLALEFTRHFVAEGRIGSNSIGGFTFEYDLGPDTSQPYQTGEFAWTNGSPVALRLAFNGTTAEFNVDGRPILQYNPAITATPLDIFIRTRGEAGKSTIEVNDLLLDGENAGVSQAPPTDYLWVRGGTLDSFELLGNSLMTWTGAPPTQSALAYQIKVGTVVPEPSSLFALLGGFGTLGGLLIRRRK